jgi:hypothetical protein
MSSSAAILSMAASPAERLFCIVCGLATEYNGLAESAAGYRWNDSLTSMSINPPVAISELPISELH